MLVICWDINLYWTSRNNTICKIPDEFNRELVQRYINFIFSGFNLNDYISDDQFDPNMFGINIIRILNSILEKSTINDAEAQQNNRNNQTNFDTDYENGVRTTLNNTIAFNKFISLFPKDDWKLSDVRGCGKCSLRALIHGCIEHYKLFGIHVTPFTDWKSLNNRMVVKLYIVGLMEIRRIYHQPVVFPDPFVLAEMNINDFNQMTSNTKNNIFTVPGYADDFFGKSFTINEWLINNPNDWYNIKDDMLDVFGEFIYKLPNWPATFAWIVTAVFGCNVTDIRVVPATDTLEIRNSMFFIHDRPNIPVWTIKSPGHYNSMSPKTVHVEHNAFMNILPTITSCVPG